MEQKYLLELEGNPVGRLFSVSGGAVEADVYTSSGGVPHKHVGPVRFQDIAMTCGTGMSHTFYEWIGSAFSGKSVLKDGALIALDDHSQASGRLEFSHAFVSSVILPALDKSANKEAFLTVSITPELLRSKGPDKATNLGVYTSAQQKAWKIADFQVKIQGLETECRYVTRIEPLSLGQSSAMDASGDAREPVNVPTKGPNFSDLILSLPESQGDGFGRWFNDFVLNGNSTPDKEKTGSVDYLGPGSSTPYFGLTFKGLGIHKIDRTSPVGGAKSTAPMKVGMYCDNITFSAGAAAMK